MDQMALWPQILCEGQQQRSRDKVGHDCDIKRTQFPEVKGVDVAYDGTALCCISASADRAFEMCDSLRAYVNGDDGKATVECE